MMNIVLLGAFCSLQRAMYKYSFTVGIQSKYNIVSDLDSVLLISEETGEALVCAITKGLGMTAKTPS